MKLIRSGSRPAVSATSGAQLGNHAQVPVGAVGLAGQSEDQVTILEAAQGRPRLIRAKAR